MERAQGVSIPFKREGTFRLVISVTIEGDKKVSIPFKREGTFRQEVVEANSANADAFQFPSNGKAHSDPVAASAAVKCKLSFNSLQTGRHIQTDTGVTFKGGLSFNSLQTGRHIQTKWRELTNETESDWFQFPSNGKAHSDNHGSGNTKMSSPSLFQFPSNGKAHSDRLISPLRVAGLNSSFNSLQTGRHIQTICTDTSVPPWQSFNSLQTGRHIQTKEEGKER